MAGRPVQDPPLRPYAQYRAGRAARWARALSGDLQRSRQKAGRWRLAVLIVLGGAVLAGGLATANTFGVVAGAACLGMGVLIAIGIPLVEWRSRKLAERISKYRSTE
jgi:peptidoglycan/LPS O-acetylase OafA/YrhL